MRDGNNFATFVDGQRIAANKFFIGELEFCWGVKLGYAVVRGAQHFKGQISNAIVKGTSFYDPTSTSVSYPTAPLTNVTNTKLLCCTSPTSETTAYSS